jgi:hypothetical protein
MKLLLDENLPHQLRHEIVGHDVTTVAYMGWSGVDNGRLLEQAAAAGFEALVSNDRGLEYEQDSTALPLAIIVLLAPKNTIDALRLLLPELYARLSTLQPCEFVKIPSA